MPLQLQARVPRPVDGRYFIRGVACTNSKSNQGTDDVSSYITAQSLPCHKNAHVVAHRQTYFTGHKATAPEQ